NKRDANAFTCAIYIGGSKVGQCAIWLNSGRNMGIGDIGYSQDGVIGNAYNEILTIDNNGQILGFRPSMGVFSPGYSRDTLLTNEGMADHLWDMFFEPIKQQAR
ncbi:toll/interleukin-1 receptor domain-containing protein, partial [Escherichia coli O25]|nr:toll/interleukin-1 receptor domain-containing protein [Escherichia coli O25]